MHDIFGAIVSISDKSGIVDMHIVRYLYLAIFDQRIHTNIFSKNVVVDCLMIVFILIPMFIYGLKFWTAPIYSAYATKVNTLIVPLSFGPIFFSHHIDLIFMGVLVLLMNAYVFWYHVDPPEEFKDSRRRYTRHRGSYNGNSRDDSSDEAYTNRTDYSSSITDVSLRALSAGMPLPNIYT